MSPEALIQEIAALGDTDRSRFFNMLHDIELDAVDPKVFVEYWNKVEKSSSRWYTMDDLDALIEEKERQERNDSL
jgi:hypothetical protein